ncbi:MAG: hypothetical protein K2J00_05320 [Bacteroidaceae bacterium]|nr:hypothetical protein [Bacteroidaceae bacterium]
MISKGAMTNKYINYIIACETNRLKAQNDPFIKHGYMGMCLFLFEMYEITLSESYYKSAQNFLQLSCASIKRGSKVNVFDGLSGIGLAVVYLHKKKYITGNIYQILKNIDNEIYRNVINEIDYKQDFSTHGHEEALIDVALYMIERLKVCSLPQIEEEIIKLFVNKIINLLYQCHDYAFYLEPIPYTSNYKLARFIFLLGKAYSIDMCTDRVLHIWEEARSTVLAQLPYLDCNKVLLLFALTDLQKKIPGDKKLCDIIATLKSCISIKQIVYNEISADAMSMQSGLPVILDVILRMNLPLTQTDIVLLENKVKNSSYYNMEYDRIIENKFVGLNGILCYILSHLKINRFYG